VLDQIVAWVLIAAAVALLFFLAWRSRSRERGTVADVLAPPPGCANT
jgi:hypothetical protein